VIGHEETDELEPTMPKLYHRAPPGPAETKPVVHVRDAGAGAATSPQLRCVLEAG